MQAEERTSDLLAMGKHLGRANCGSAAPFSSWGSPRSLLHPGVWGVCVLPQLPSSCPTPSELNSQLPHRSLAIDGPVRDGQQDWGAEDGGP